ncbi:MAG: mandelate racemase/muconate lactonizing enzyme family protein [Candidatus Bathyarchaeia archaeon]
MRIREVVARAVSVPLEGEARAGFGRFVKRDAVLVRIETGDGLVGIGEAHHAKSPTVIEKLINANLRPLLLGRDPFQIELIWQTLYSQYSPASPTHGVGSAGVIALSGVDIALWDLLGKALGQPLYNLLGGRYRPKIRAYVGGLALGWKGIEELLGEARRYVGEGFTALKLRIGRGVEEDVELVRAAREGLGDKVDLMVDANSRYSSAKEAIRLADRLAGLGIAWLEEPFPSDRLAPYRALAKRARIPIAAGENHFTRFGLQPLIQLGLIDIAQPDVTKSGGLTELRKIAAMADAWGISLAPHIYPSGVGMAAALHLLVSVPNALIAEYEPPGDNPLMAGLLKNPIRAIDGFLEPPEGPGLGIEIDEAFVEDHPGIDGPAYV